MGTESKLRHPILISAVLHLGVLVFVLISFIPKYPFQKERILELEISQLDSNNNSVTPLRQSMGLSAPKKSAGAPSGAGDLPPGPGEEVYTGIDGYEVSRKMGYKTEGKTYPFLNRLHERISNSLEYPEILIRTGRKGKVTVQFEIDRLGRFTGRFVSISGDDRYLAVHVLRTLKKVLRNPIDTTFSLPMENLRVVTNFQFGIYPHPAYFPKPDTPLLRNILSFSKYVVRNGSLMSMSDLPGGRLSLDLDVIRSIDSVIELLSPSDQEKSLDLFAP